MASGALDIISQWASFLFDMHTAEKVGWSCDSALIRQNIGGYILQHWLRQTFKWRKHSHTLFLLFDVVSYEMHKELDEVVVWMVFLSFITLHLTP